VSYQIIRQEEEEFKKLLQSINDIIQRNSLKYPFLPFTQHLMVLDKNTGSRKLLIECTMHDGILIIYNVISFSHQAYEVLEKLCDYWKIHSIFFINDKDNYRTTNMMKKYGCVLICSVDIYGRSVKNERKN